MKNMKSIFLSLFFLSLNLITLAQDDINSVYLDYAKYEKIGKEFIDEIKCKKFYSLMDLEKSPPVDSVYQLVIYEDSLINDPHFLTQCVEKYKKIMIVKIFDLQDSLPEVLFRLPELKELYFNNYQTDDWGLMFREIGKIHSLKSLRIYSGNLIYIPEDIKNLKHIERLEILNVPLLDIDDCFIELTNLKYLEISETSLSFFPPNYHNDNLIVLDLTSNRFNGIPSEIMSLNKIEKLSFNGNVFYSEDVDILCCFKKLKTLELQQCGLEIFPEKLTCLNELEILFIGFNRITSFNKGIVGFPSLRLLNLSGYKGNRIEIESLKKQKPNCFIQLVGSEDVRPIFDIFK